jgi:phosphohistidine phosphatase SixA
MLQLILIRHADAGPYTLPDEARPVSPKGFRELEVLRRHLLQKSCPKGLWMVSGAVRTRETSAYLLEKMVAKQVLIDESWYHASGLFYLEKIRNQEEPILYLVAHNPSISFVASHFLGECIHMDTASCVHLYWPMATSWDEVIGGSAILMP